MGLLDESALRTVEAIVAGADHHGCTPEQSVHVFRGVWYPTVGEVLVRARSPHRRADDGRPAFRESFGASRLPHPAAIGDRWPAPAGRDTCPQGLRALVEGLLAQTSGRPRTRRAEGGHGDPGGTQWCHMTPVGATWRHQSLQWRHSGATIEPWT